MMLMVMMLATPMKTWQKKWRQNKKMSLMFYLMTQLSKNCSARSMVFLQLTQKSQLRNLPNKKRIPTVERRRARRMEVQKRRKNRRTSSSSSKEKRRRRNRHKTMITRPTVDLPPRRTMTPSNKCTVNSRRITPTWLILFESGSVTRRTVLGLVEAQGGRMDVNGHQVCRPYLPWTRIHCATVWTKIRVTERANIAVAVIIELAGTTATTMRIKIAIMMISYRLIPFRNCRSLALRSVHAMATIMATTIVVIITLAAVLHRAGNIPMMTAGEEGVIITPDRVIGTGQTSVTTVAAATEALHHMADMVTVAGG
mmetsp:Transcript_17378/g.29979  ORF Transcript_17378/g.29979 Transcript_17378/m.29979 type:complete len:312 (-) Transcript_17378:515-1450(-)